MPNRGWWGGGEEKGKEHRVTERLEMNCESEERKNEDEVKDGRCGFEGSGLFSLGTEGARGVGGGEGVECS